MEKFYGEIAIEQNQLESFENRNPDKDYMIEFECPEFTCLCPISGFPDFATIRIYYVPHQKCVELKSLKLYINQFRDKKIFHEDVTNWILKDLVDLLSPRWMLIETDFNVRGNIHTQVRTVHKKGDFEPSAFLYKSSRF